MNRQAEYDKRMNIDAFDWENEENDYEDEYVEDEHERLLSECGKIKDGTCMLAGTEHCDWDCPLSG